MQQPQILELTLWQIFLIGMAVGFVFGLIPLVLGIARKNLKLGLIALAAATLAGLIWSLLGIFVAMLFSVLILVRKPAIQPHSSQHAD
jgi:hypothetical protein